MTRRTAAILALMLLLMLDIAHAEHTREDVRALDRKLDDHSARITKMEAHIEEHDRRISRIEDKEER